MCTRCIPRVGRGDTEPLDAKYKKALEAAKKAKLKVRDIPSRLFPLFLC